MQNLNGMVAGHDTLLHLMMRRPQRTAAAETLKLGLETTPSLLISPMCLPPEFFPSNEQGRWLVFIDFASVWPDSL